jgi:ATP-dependent Lon protease
VKEKVLAALRAGIKTVMLPKRNQKDLEDVRGRAKLEFVLLENVEDAVRRAVVSSRSSSSRARMKKSRTED